MQTPRREEEEQEHDLKAGEGEVRGEEEGGRRAGGED